MQTFKELAEIYEAYKAGKTIQYRWCDGVEWTTVQYSGDPRVEPGYYRIAPEPPKEPTYKNAQNIIYNKLCKGNAWIRFAATPSVAHLITKFRNDSFYLEASGNGYDYSYLEAHGARIVSFINVEYVGGTPIVRD